MPSTATGLILALTRFLFKDKSLVLLTQGLGAQPFHGNIVVFINEWTSSAAEMVANFAAENKLATVVGSKTSGTVLGARNIEVGGRYWLRLPVFGWLTSNGGSIEGAGVVPDVVVDPLPAWISGKDTQLDTACALLGGYRDKEVGDGPRLGSRIVHGRYTVTSQVFVVATVASEAPRGLAARPDPRIL